MALEETLVVAVPPRSQVALFMRTVSQAQHAFFKHNCSMRFKSKVSCAVLQARVAQVHAAVSTLSPLMPPLAQAGLQELELEIPK